MHRPSLRALEAKSSPPRLRGEMLRDELTRAIHDGRLLPGERLDEVRLAQLFGVSRTPVREALRQLAVMRLVEIRPHRGAVVAVDGPATVRDLLEAAVEIGAACARLAARRCDPVLLALLAGADEAWRQAAAAADPEGLRRAHADLEAAIVAAAGNEVLAELATSLRRRMTAGGPWAGSHAVAPEGLLAAIEAGEVDAADRAMRAWLGDAERPSAAGP